MNMQGLFAKQSNRPFHLFTKWWREACRTRKWFGQTFGELFAGRVCWRIWRCNLYWGGLNSGTSTVLVSRG